MICVLGTIYVYKKRIFMNNHMHTNIILDCHENAIIHKGQCTCNEGYAGNGFLCGIDSDFGNYVFSAFFSHKTLIKPISLIQVFISDHCPDIELDCDEKTCRKDNCVHKSNPNQKGICDIMFYHTFIVCSIIKQMLVEYDIKLLDIRHYLCVRQ